MALPIAIATSVIGLFTKFIDKAVPDKQQAGELQRQFASYVHEANMAELQAAVSIIVAEAKGESWLQRNWRPGLMVWFALLIGMFWFGAAPEYLVKSPELVDKLFDIIQWGIAGYVGGRSVEKVAEIVTHKR
ncbi:hypothetical protein HC928_00605 [bacterium]|nr:hypothetical protein [bacterium]